MSGNNLVEAIPQGSSSNAHAGSRTRVTSMGGLYDAATLRALVKLDFRIGVAACNRDRTPARPSGGASNGRRHIAVARAGGGAGR